jgi:hypothetical protein
MNYWLLQKFLISTALIVLDYLYGHCMFLCPRHTNQSDGCMQASAAFVACTKESSLQ